MIRRSLRFACAVALCTGLLALRGGAALAECGDSVVDADEQCDQGASNGAATSCCSAACAYVDAGTVCRAASGTCDVAEACDGASDTCPVNVVAPGCRKMERCSAENPNLWGLRFQMGAAVSVATCQAQCRQGGGNGYLCLSAVTGYCLCGTSAKPTSTNPPTTGCTASCAGTTDQCGGPPSLYTCYAAGDAAPPTSTPAETPTDTPVNTPTDTPSETPTATATPVADACPVTAHLTCANGKGTLRLQMTEGHGQLRWRMRRGALDGAALGDPTAGTEYRLCLYTDGMLVHGFGMGPGSAWRKLRNGDLRYTQGDGSPDGITRLYMDAGQRRGKIYVGGRGDFLKLPALPLTYVSDVRVQLSAGDKCWESVLPAPASRNDDSRYLDRAQ